MIIESNENDLRILNKNNLLIKANYNLNLVENKFYLTILFNMQKTSRGNYVGIIPKDEFIRLSGKTTNNTSLGISRILESLSSKRVQIQEFKKNNKKPSDYDFPIITGYKFNAENNTYSIELSTILYDLLLEYMEVGYTPLNLGVMLGLNNFYAQRLYELLRLWSSSKEVITYKVDYLRECFGLEEKYKKYTDFRKRVIAPSIDALNSTEKFNISIKENKVSRNIDSIDFIIRDLDKRKYFDKKDIVVIDKEDIENDISNSDIIKNTKLVNSDKRKSNEVKSKVYVPDVSIFTTGTLRAFKKDFKDYDFRKEYCMNAFEDSVMITLEKDEVENIKASSYKYFKATLINKLEEYKTEYEKDIKFKEELKKYW